jgi:hypothetical protein
MLVNDRVLIAVLELKRQVMTDLSMLRSTVQDQYALLDRIRQMESAPAEIPKERAALFESLVKDQKLSKSQREKLLESWKIYIEPHFLVKRNSVGFLPCPWCSHPTVIVIKPKQVTPGTQTDYVAMCEGCDCEGPWAITPELARDNWNNGFRAKRKKKPDVQNSGDIKKCERS